MYSVVLLDDEPKSSDILESLISHWLPEISAIHCFQKQNKAAEFIKNNSVDLLFLDIQMPSQNGFDFLANLDVQSPPVIFVTAHDKFAIQALRLSAVDYLLKPVDPEDLVASFNRFKKQNGDEYQAQVKNSIQNVQQPEAKDMRIFIPGNSGIQFYKIEDIIRCEAQSNYTVFHFANGRKKVSSKTMKEYVNLLKPFNFIRVHKSHFVNASFIEKIRNRTEIVLRDKTLIPIARRRKDEVLRLLKIKS